MSKQASTMMFDQKVVAGPMGAIRAAEARQIGGILIDAGRLKPADAERVIRTQKEFRLRFGETAIKLGLITESDLRQGLSLQFDFPFLVPDLSHVSTEVIAAYDPFSPRVEKLRALRTQLMLRWFAQDSARKMLTVVSPAKGEGRSYLVANLSVVFSQLGKRTLLIDGDLRKPRQHALFKLPNALGLSSLIAERAGHETVQKIPGFANLSVLPAGPVPPNPQELLSRPSFGHWLSELAERFDVILLDTAAASPHADAQIVCAHTKAAMVTALADHTSTKQFRQLISNFNQTGVHVVGTVLNRIARR
jgi:receptor protein-tyrosine kinase